MVASVADVAASGGYYIAMGCERIVCDDLSITGSIGVVSAVLKIGELLEKVRHGCRFMAAVFAGLRFLFYYITMQRWNKDIFRVLTSGSFLESHDESKRSLARYDQTDDTDGVELRRGVLVRVARAKVSKRAPSCATPRPHLVQVTRSVVVRCSVLPRQWSVRACVFDVPQGRLLCRLSSVRSVLARWMFG